MSPFLFILVAAFALRVWGVGFGIYHADEPIVVNHALAYGSGDLNPHFFAIPPLMSYLCFIVYGAFYLIGHAAAWFSDLRAYERLIFERPEVFYVLGRWACGVVPGVLTVWIVYRDLKQWRGASCAVWASAAIAFNFLHVRDSHVIYTDIWMALAVWCAVMTAKRYLDGPSLRLAAAMGLWIGLATAVKYNAALVGSAGLLAWALMTRSPKHLLALSCAAGLAFVLLNPFALIDHRYFINAVLQQAQAEGLIGWLHPLKYSLAESCGWWVLLVAFYGIWVSFAEGRARAAVFWIFPAIFYFKLTVFSQQHERYVMPLIPFVAAGFGIGVANLKNKAKARGVPAMVPLFAAILMLSYGAVKSVYADYLFSQADTRDLAARWIEKNLPAGEQIAFTDTRLRPRLWRHPDQWPDRSAVELSPLQLKRDALLQEIAKDKPAYRLAFVSRDAEAKFSGVWPLIEPSVDALRAGGVDYVVVHHEWTDRYPELLDDLQKNARLVTRFTPYRDAGQNKPLDAWAVTFAAYDRDELAARERFGPVLEVYAL